MICENPTCQAVFEPTRSDRKYCTRKCKENSKRIKGSRYAVWRSNWQKEQRRLGKPVGRKTYTKFKGDVCEFCGFIPVNKVQLDVDHIDGDHSNNDPSNLQTLCANCHRLKTFIQRWS